MGERSEPRENARASGVLARLASLAQNRAPGQRSFVLAHVLSSQVDSVGVHFESVWKVEGGRWVSILANSITKHLRVATIRSFQ